MVRPAHTLLLATTLVAAACGSAPPRRGPRSTDLRVIDATRANEIIEDAAREANVRLATGWRIDVGAEEPFEVGFRMGDTSFGIEWVTAQDRQDHGTVIPQPDPGGQLRIMPGGGDDEGTQVLVLEESAYRYDPDIERVQRGSTGVREAEGRLRRDIQDYFVYVRGQGGL